MYLRRLLVVFACLFAPFALLAQTQPPPFLYTGSPQTWIVPAGVTSITVDVQGAQGGASPTVPSILGGLGGRVQTTLSVTPGEALTIYVGGKGGDFISLNTAGPGGFNGGGAGGIDNVDGNGPASGGGGASDIRQGGTDLGHRVVVAGGGGGAECCTDANGGAGGGLVGMDGGTFGTSTPGLGGTQTSGGAGGGGCNGVGTAGTLGQGGVGGNGNRAGGGGGGGYYGGGGGGGCLYGSGGGGGSSYSAGTNTIHTQGFQSGDGQVTISVVSSATKPQVIVVPGILGTKLVSTSPLCDLSLTGCVPWLSNRGIAAAKIPFLGALPFASLEYDVNGMPTSDLALAGIFNLNPNPTLLVGDQLDCGVLGPAIDLLTQPLGCGRTFNPYNKLVQGLIAGGFAPNVSGSDLPAIYDATTFAYDWRDDIATNAEALYGRIQGLSGLDPSRPVGIVAHSMGGLIVGEMLRRHSQGLRTILGPVITLGTPYAGSPEAYLELQGWHQSSPFSKTATRELAATWTSAYELLPRSSFVNEASVSNPFSYYSVYRGQADPSNFPTLSRQGAVDIAENLWAGIALPYAQGYAIVGGGKATPIGITTMPLLLSSAGSTPANCAGPVAILGNGDGTVPQNSAVPAGPVYPAGFVPSDHVWYVSESHAGLPTNDLVIQAISQILSGQDPSANSGLSKQPFSFGPAWESLTCSPVQISAQDSAGHVTNDVSEEIGGSTSFRFGEHTQLWVPQGQVYTFQLAGTGVGVFSWFLRDVDENGLPTSTTTFLGVPVTPSSKGQVNISDSGVSSLAYDYNGTGAIDTIPANVVPPTISCHLCRISNDETQANTSFDVGYIGAVSTFTYDSFSHRGAIHLASTRVDQIAVSGTTAAFSGAATINGTPGYFFSIRVKAYGDQSPGADDPQEPGQPRLYLSVTGPRHYRSAASGRVIGPLVIEP
jgi:pimeloyl-ACP methyl ester carboxylesterase